jgi:hypothetical protein
MFLGLWWSRTVWQNSLEKGCSTASCTLMVAWKQRETERYWGWGIFPGHARYDLLPPSKPHLPLSTTSQKCHPIMNPWRYYSLIRSEIPGSNHFPKSHKLEFRQPSLQHMSLLGTFQIQTYLLVEAVHIPDNRLDNGKISSLSLVKSVGIKHNTSQYFLRFSHWKVKRRIWFSSMALESQSVYLQK